MTTDPHAHQSVSGLTDDLVNLAARRYRSTAEAARRYDGGETLAEIADSLDVAPSTLTRELQLAGVPIRRRGRRASG